MQQIKNVAVLFDIENISCEDLLEPIFQKLKEKSFNVCTRKIVFNNVTQLKKTYLGKAIKTYHLDLICTYATSGKNIADFRIYMEVMDSLYQHPEIDGYCIVSRDADYSELVIRLKHEQKYTIGIGSKSKCNPEYAHLYDEFYYVEDLLNASNEVLVLQSIPSLVIEEPQLKEEPKKQPKEEVKKQKKEKKATPKKAKQETKKEPKQKKKEVTPSSERVKKRTEKDKTDSFFKELKENIEIIFREYQEKHQNEIYYSTLVKELKSHSYYLDSFSKITHSDIEKSGFSILMKNNQKERAYLTIDISKAEEV